MERVLRVRRPQANAQPSFSNGNGVASCAGVENLVSSRGDVADGEEEVNIRRSRILRWDTHIQV